MRIYVRNKTKYDPANAGKPLVFVEFSDPRKFTIGQVKEEFKKKVRAAKVDSLYSVQEDGSYKVLADDRTIGYYNLQDNTILETTSNPFWAAAIYYRLREVEANPVNNPEDPRVERGLEQSAIQKYMALGILFNGNNPQQSQPPYFEELDQLFEHLTTAGKKPVHMSQQTLDTLQTLKDEFLQNDLHEHDPIGCFVHRQAVRLGLISEADAGDMQHGSGRIHHHEGATNRIGGGRQLQRTNADTINNGLGRGRGRCSRENGSGRGRKANGPGRGGRRVPQQERMCEDCEDNVATQFCADCQPPLVLCDNCSAVLHMGATRRKHQLKDVSDAPPPPRDRSYTPKAYRAPFAMLVAFHRASNEVPSKMSLTADELKPRAQPLTNTDLEDKQGGKWFGGFDSLENTLMKNDLVQKEAARTPKYSLMERGQTLAASCSEFDYAIQNLTQAASVPTIPVMRARPVFQNHQICLLVDTEEPLRDRFVKVARQRGLAVRTRKLPVGDFLWVLLPPGVNPDIAQDMPQQELVLPMIVERKTWDDLWSSLKTPRFASQVNRMKNSGLENLFYLMEGSPRDLRGHPGVEVEKFLQDQIDNLLIQDHFLVNRTGSWVKSVEWLCHLTNMAAELLQLEVNPNLMTYSEFQKAGKAKKHLRDFNKDSVSGPVTSTVWSVSEFADIIRSHSRGGRQLQDLPNIHRTGKYLKKERSLIIIQGLTQYNKQCHSLLDKALADFLRRNPQQSAEVCVHKHLEGVTNQLIHQDVLQWYILWLQVFKGVMVRRTETEEETNEILSQFNGSAAAAEAAQPFNRVIPPQAEEERLPQDVLIFASDSQEEDAMIRQALRESKYEEGKPIYHAETSVVKQASGTARWRAETDGTCEMSHNTSKDSSYFLDTMSEEEQLAVALRLSKAECEAANSQSINRSLDLDKTVAQEYSGRLCTPETKFRASSSFSTETNFVDNDQGFSNEDSELKAVPKQSVGSAKKEPYLKQYGYVVTDNKGRVDADLERALEFSRIEYESCRFTNRRSRNGEQSMIKNEAGPYATALNRTANSEEDDLSKALQLSIEENELKCQRQETCISDSKSCRRDGMPCGIEKNQDESKQHTGNVCKPELSRSIKNSTMTYLNKECAGTIPGDEDLEKALMFSRMEYERFGVVALGGTVRENGTNNQAHCGNKLVHSNDYSVIRTLEQSNTRPQQEKKCVGMDSLQGTGDNCPESDREKVTQSLECSEHDELLELTQLGYEQSKDNTARCALVKTMKTSDITSSNELSKDSHLERALDLSRIEYDQHNVGAVKHHNLNTTEDPDVVVVEEHFADKTKDCASCSPRKPFLVNEASEDGFVPSSLASECLSQERSKDFEALNPVQSSGKSKHCPISVDSQDFDDDILEVQEVKLGMFPEDNRRLSSSTEGNIAIDDFAFAVQLQKELDQESRPSANKSDQTHNTVSFSGVTEQLSTYRQLQKEKYSAFYGKKDKSSPGLQFRRNVAALACGKPVKVGVASPMSRSGRSQNGWEPVRDDFGRRSTGTSPSSCTETSAKRSQLFPSGPLSSPKPTSPSVSTFNRTEGSTQNDTLLSKCHSRSAPDSPSSSSSSSSFDQLKTIEKSSASDFSSCESKNISGPTCGACGQKGHSKSCKICPQYYSEENVQRREEQSRKRKAKKEEEEREFQDQLGALAAQRLVIEDQVEQLRRQSQNMANTQKRIEDSIKRRRKR